MCLHDQIVIHLAPISPLLLQPGDFYLQVAPFCDQSARIVVCSLLEEEGLPAELVEETPIPETFYPCIFSCDWLDEINHGRQGTPLSQCLLATEQGVVRLPWERVAVPDFVDVPPKAGSSMASAPPSYPSLPPPLPLPSPSLPDFAEKSASNKSFPLSSPKKFPIAVRSSGLTSSSHPSAFSVETRICQAKHGIAVSLCLVDTSAASSSRLVKVKETETDPKPVGWVSPNTWDCNFTGIDPNTATKTSSVSNTHIPASGDRLKIQNKSVTVYENPHKKEGADIIVEGEYIDVQQATMLFAKAQSRTEEQRKSEVQFQPQTQVQMQKYPQRPSQIQPYSQKEPHRQTQRQPGTQIPPNAQSHVQFPTKPQCHSTSVPAASLGPNMSAETGSPSTHSHSQPHHQPQPDSLQPSQCFSEKPCTPCMRRRQGGKVTRAQELRCRYRESYQAALQNPVTFGQAEEMGNMLAVVEEDGDFSLRDDTQGPTESETGESCYNIQGTWCHQSPSSVSEAICEESGERNTVPYWTPAETDTVHCVDYRRTNASQFAGLPKQTTDRTAVPFRNIRDAHSADSYGSVNGSDSAAMTRLNTTNVMSGSNGPTQSDVSTKHPRLPCSSSDRLQNRANNTGMFTNSSQNRRELESNGRCSSLSTAVVDTSEKCQVVIVDGRNVRRRENTDSCAEVPQLHVVKCKNSTAFGLVSPKIIRRKMVVPGRVLLYCFLRRCCWVCFFRVLIFLVIFHHNKIEKLSTDGAQSTTTNTNARQTERSPQANQHPLTQKTFQPASTRPRPDHLPLGSPDPRAHPIYLGVASLTGNII